MIKSIAFIFLILSPPSHSTMYQWRDDNGKLHFSDTPPSEKKYNEVNLKPINKSSPIETRIHTQKKYDSKKTKKNYSNKTQNNRHEEYCKNADKKYRSFRRSGSTIHYLMDENGKSLTEKEQKKALEEFRAKANKNGCNIEVKKP